MRAGSVGRLGRLKRRQVIRAVELLAILVVAVVATVPSMLTKPRLNYDSVSYLAPVSLTGERLPVVPLVYAALHRNLVAIVVFQAVFGGLCWAYLAYQALVVAPRPACYVAFLGVLLLSCTDYVTHWYSAILSDSLSLSLLALLLGSLASWLARRGSLARVVIVAVAWALTRDTNGYVLLLFGTVGLVVVLLRRRRPSELAAAMVAILAGVAVIVSTDAGQLWQQPFLHVMSERVLVSPTATAFFAAHGMPVTPTLLHLAGPYYPATDTALRHAPQLAGFRAWMNRAGERTYLEYALLHPWWALSGTFGGNGELSDALIIYYGGTPKHPWIPPAIRGILMSARQTVLLVGTAVTALVLLGCRRTLSSGRRALLWWAAVVLTGYLGLVFAWVGDSWEFGRHAVGATVQIAVGLVFLVSVALGTIGTGTEPSALQAVDGPPVERSGDRVPEVGAGAAGLH